MPRILQTVLLAATTLISPVLSLSNFQPLSSTGPSYSIGIPASSSISASSTGPLYIQITAPTSYRWVGFGIGEQMAGAKIFVIYADGNGNVTVSARDGGQGHVQPTADEELQRGVKLLAGSGIVDGKMVANIRADSYSLSSAKDDSASPFIAAWMSGSPLDSTSVSAEIRQHSGNANRQFTFNLAEASINSDSSPFVSSTSSGTPPSSSSDDGNDDDDDGDDKGGASVTGSGSDSLATYQKAHGIIMGVTVVLLFPLGAIFMRLGGTMIGHATLQLFSLAAMVAGIGLGIKLGKMTDLLFKQTHTILGLVIFILFLIQPFLGLIHHLQYKKTQSRSAVSHIHIYFGRAMMILGVINGGTGIKLAANTNGGKIAYGVVAGVVGLTYLVLVLFKRKGRKDGDGVIVDGERRKGRWGLGREKREVVDGSS